MTLPELGTVWTDGDKEYTVVATGYERTRTRCDGYVKLMPREDADHLRENLFKPPPSDTAKRFIDIRRILLGDFYDNFEGVG